MIPSPSSKTAHKAKHCNSKINFQILPKLRVLNGSRGQIPITKHTSCTLTQQRTVIKYKIQREGPFNGILNLQSIKGKVKAKFTQEQAIKTLSGSKAVQLYSSFNFGARSEVFNATLRPLYPWEWHVPTVQETGWVRRSVWTGAANPPPGFDPRTAQTVESRYTDWAIPAHNHKRRHEQ